MPTAEEIAQAQEHLFYFDKISLDIVDNQLEIRRLSKGSVCMATLVYMYVVFRVLVTHIQKPKQDLSDSIKNNKMAIFIAAIVGIVLPAMIFKFGLEAMEEHLNKEFDSVAEDVAKYYAAKEMQETFPTEFETDSFKIKFVQTYEVTKLFYQDKEIVGSAFGILAGVVFILLVAFYLPDYIGKGLMVISAIVFLVFSALRVASGYIQKLKTFNRHNNDVLYRYITEMRDQQERFVKYFDNPEDFRHILRNYWIQPRV